MKVFSVFGITRSGKTTVLEKVISELRRRRFSVGTVKDIHFEGFAIDTAGTNTDRHRKAGSQLVTARGLKETDVLFPSRLSVPEILTFYDHDYVILEGVEDFNVPKIITAHSTAEVDERLDDAVFAISGMLAEQVSAYRGLPVINVLTDTATLVDLILAKVPVLMPDFPPECCTKCGMSCRELLAAVLRGERRRSDCVLDRSDVRLKIGGREITMVPFVQEVIKKTIVGLVSTLEGYKEHSELNISIGGSGKDD